MLLKRNNRSRLFDDEQRLLGEDVTRRAPAPQSSSPGRAPVDACQQKLETIARHRLFQAVEGPFDLNPFSKNVVFLLLHHSWMGRMRYLVTLASGEAAESRRSARHHMPSQAFGQIPWQLRQAWFHWRQYRRALARTAAAQES